MCYNGKYYSNRCLIEAILHQLLHKYINEEKHVNRLVKELMKGYEYGRIYLDNGKKWLRR